MSKYIVQGIVTEGHRVASGLAKEPRFPNGTLALQIPRFAERGLDLSGYHQGTLNVSIAPHSFCIGQAWKSFAGVKWSPVMPEENFSFYRCGIRPVDTEIFTDALVYWPHPSTKPEYFQSSSVLEILAPFIKGIGYGSEVELRFSPEEIEILDKS